MRTERFKTPLFPLEFSRSRIENQGADISAEQMDER